MIALFSDFGAQDIYVGQVKAAILARAPGMPMIDLLHDASPFSVIPAAHLLAALAPRVAAARVFFCVVDPGVGGERAGAVLWADGRWFVGPDNGLLSIVAQRAAETRHWRIAWQPEGLSSSFHGRDLFAPICAWLAADEFPADKLEDRAGLDIRLEPSDLAEVIHVDRYGNAITGLRADNLSTADCLVAGGRHLPYARVFSDAAPDTPCWHRNSIGMAEVMLNRGRAADVLDLSVGSAVRPVRE